MGKKSFSFQ